MYVLSGSAGTGKTFLMKHLIAELSKNYGLECVAFTAPTNKATKVIKKTLGIPEGSIKTIYSLLGIKMVGFNEELVLEFPRKPVDLGGYAVIFVDEASMISKDLFRYILQRSQVYPTKWVFIGDRYQLPPVGEFNSRVWKHKGLSSNLTQVMRFDNELLELATHIRQQIEDYPEYDLRIKSHHGTKRGVWKYNKILFIKHLKNAAVAGLFHQVDHTKVVAWRNKTVEDYNQIIRRAFFGEAADQNYIVGDRILLSEPVQIENRVIAHVDDEGTITSTGVAFHGSYPQHKAYHLTVALDDGRTVSLRVVHESSELSFQEHLNRLALEAKANPALWKHFWVLRNAFHRVRYSYALTAHRSQGSTFEHNAFVDTGDILSNTDEFEALRCLYVACTRPKRRLIVC